MINFFNISKESLCGIIALKRSTKACEHTFVAQEGGKKLGKEGVVGRGRHN